MRHLKLLLLTLSVFGICRSSADVLGCSGFVRSGSDSGSLDYSLMRVAVFNSLGSKTEETEVAPKSGYFFLPVDGKGSYVLKVLKAIK